MKQRRKTMGLRRGVRMDALRARLDARRALNQEHIAERQAWAREWLEERGKDRAERIRARREAVRQKWGGDLVAHPGVRAELRLHAWRMARLRTIKQIAQKEGREKLAARADALIAREVARHERRMGQLKENPNLPPSGSASAAPPASAGGVGKPLPSPATSTQP